jgi:hypothetical protein
MGIKLAWCMMVVDETIKRILIYFQVVLDNKIINLTHAQPHEKYS